LQLAASISPDQNHISVTGKRTVCNCAW